MRPGLQLATGTLLLLLGLGLMAYTVYALDGLPHLYWPVLLWLTFVEYAVGRAWWMDVQDFTESRKVRA